MKTLRETLEGLSLDKLIDAKEMIHEIIRDKSIAQVAGGIIVVPAFAMATPGRGEGKSLIRMIQEELHLGDHITMEIKDVHTMAASSARMTKEQEKSFSLYMDNEKEPNKNPFPLYGKDPGKVFGRKGKRKKH